MIRTKTEYQRSLALLQKQEQRIRGVEQGFREKGWTVEEVERALDPLRSFHDEIREEVSTYERVRAGEIESLTTLRGLGETLTALRIARGLSQRELAQRLSVHVAQISRDERNAYRGITLERAARVLEALGADVRTSFEFRPAPRPPDTATSRTATATAAKR